MATPTDAPTPTATRTPTTTPTNTQASARTQTPTATITRAITLTLTATPTPTRLLPSAFSMNGTFSHNCEDKRIDQKTTRRGIYTSGLIKITVDFSTGAASGSISGGGTRTYSDDSAIKWIMNVQYDATLNGTVDRASGALSLVGKTNAIYDQPYTECNASGDCGNPRRDFVSIDITVTGSADRVSRTGKGTTSQSQYAGSVCDSFWSAGE
ncbi:MAG: hypothetical protein KGJ80_17655 [Chloroflexota bacterium]|nr:hypothetical protein [Chloroflexota bacterium]